MAEKIIIASGKGGSGKTSVCTGVALSLAKKGFSVLVVDCDIAQGCIDFMLGLKSETIYNWGDIILGNCSAEDAVSSSKGVDYFTAPSKWDDRFTAEAMTDFIKEVDIKYTHILFDSPAGISGGFTLAAGCADRAVVVSTPDEICVNAAGRAASELFDAGVNDVRLVINRFDKVPTQRGKYLNIDETIDGVGIQLIGVVPEDSAVSYASSTGFVGLEDCPAKSAYERIAGRLTGKRIPLVISNKNQAEKSGKGKKAFAGFICSLLIVAVLAAAAVFFTDFYMARNLSEPVFEIKPMSVQADELTSHKGFCYDYFVVRDNDGKIVSTEMRVAGKVVSAAIS